MAISAKEENKFLKAVDFIKKLFNKGGENEKSKLENLYGLVTDNDVSFFLSSWIFDKWNKAISLPVWYPSLYCCSVDKDSIISSPSKPSKYSVI